MSEAHILRVPRTDDDNDYVLIQVTSSGKKELDVKLVATESLAPYVVQLRHDRVSSYKDRKHACPEDEWERILTEFLLDRQSTNSDIEAVAQVDSNQSISLIVRRSISGIKQRIGTITLKCDEAESIDLFDWCGSAIGAKEQIKAELVAAKSKAEELGNAVNELKDQLEELIKAKQADESELLVKFRDLLNEKKVKIREQQRLLMASNVDRDQIGAIRAPRSKSPEVAKGHTPKPSRASKRKAAEPEPEPEPEVKNEVAETDDELVKMEVDKRHGEEDSEDDRTTDADATASEIDDDEPIPARRHITRDIDKPPAASTRHASQKKQSSPPPPRTLPFNRGKPAAKPAPAAEPEGSETESDDEL